MGDQVVFYTAGTNQIPVSATDPLPVTGISVTISHVVLDAGSAIAGKFGIDQTTNGTTNAVAIVGGTAANITTNTTTVVKSGAGVLNSISINTKGGSSNTATIYDNTAGSGTKLGTIDTTASIGQIGYGIAFSTGLTIVTATGSAGDLTVNYR